MVQLKSVGGNHEYVNGGNEPEIVVAIVNGIEWQRVASVVVSAMEERMIFNVSEAVQPNELVTVTTYCPEVMVGVTTMVLHVVHGRLVVDVHA